jgi:hypothetical protein
MEVHGGRWLPLIDERRIKLVTSNVGSMMKFMHMLIGKIGIIVHAKFA